MDGCGICTIRIGETPGVCSGNVFSKFIRVSVPTSVARISSKKNNNNKLLGIRELGLATLKSYCHCGLLVEHFANHSNSPFYFEPQ